MGETIPLFGVMLVNNSCCFYSLRLCHIVQTHTLSQSQTFLNHYPIPTQTTNTRTASKHNKLLELISEFGLQNMAYDPTRIESGNILDLILISNPSIITNTHTTPGMSDHEAVTFEVNLNPIRNRKPPHKVFKYKSADW